MGEKYEGKLFFHNPKNSKTNESFFASGKLPRSNKLSEQSVLSTPINIPNRSKIYRRSRSSEEEEEDEMEEKEEEEERVPPHEWLAKKLQRSQISSSSVCEGAGRTLKGRDQSKVRDAVLKKTGYLQ